MNYTEPDSFKNGTSALEKSHSLNSSSDKVVPMNITLGASYAELLFTTKSNIGWVFGTAMPTGWILLIILFVIEIFAMPCIRKKGFFQVNTFFGFTYDYFYSSSFVHILNRFSI
jgi:hypothetical protein